MKIMQKSQSRLSLLSARRAKRALPYTTNHQNLKPHVEYSGVTCEWMGAPLGK